MIRFYTPKLSFDDSPVEGSHTYGLPFCECPECDQVGAASGLAYPWIDVREVFGQRESTRLLWERRGKKTFAEYLDDARRLQGILPQCFPVAPGIELGPWKGRVLSKTCGDLVVGCLRDLLVDRKVIKLLRKEGVQIQTFETQLKPKGVFKPDLVEVWAPPVGLSCPSSGIRLCATCNRGSTKGFVCVNSATVPPQAHVFRLRDAPNALVFSRRFVEICEQHGLKGITFLPVPHEPGAEQSVEEIPLAPEVSRTGVVSETKSEKPRVKAKATSRPQSFYADWLEGIHKFAKRVAEKAQATIDLALEPPASEAEIQEVEKVLGKKLPAALARFYSELTKALRFRYSTSDGLNGGMALALDDLLDHQREVRAWAEETWIAEDSKQKKMWLKALPFAHLENGDYLALSLRAGGRDPAVVYLNHEDEGAIISSSFQSFLQEWARVYYVVPQYSTLEPFLDEDGHLSGDGEEAKNFRSIFDE